MTAAHGAAPALTSVDAFLATIPEAAAIEARLDDFMRVAGLTALRRTATDDYYLSNLRRGHLLYALVRHLRPRTVLEIGTGRGFGALSMAMAADDADLDTVIYTVDRLSPDTPQDWAMRDEAGDRMVRASITQVWASLPERWTSRVRFLTGRSTDCLHRWMGRPDAPAVDFAFIDGGHDYWTVRHDVAASLAASRGRPLAMLLDDYGGVQGHAVRDFVDRVLAPAAAPGTLTRLEMPQTEAERRDNGEHGMVFVADAGDALRTRVLGAGGGRALSLGWQRLAAVAEDRLLAARSAVGTMRRSLGARGGAA